MHFGKVQLHHQGKECRPVFGKTRTINHDLLSQLRSANLSVAYGHPSITPEGDTMRMTHLDKPLRNSNLPGGVARVGHNMELNLWPNLFQIPGRLDLRFNPQVKKDGNGGQARQPTGHTTSYLP
jgi:hypothetical protein